ncbi:MULTISPECIES: DUF1937 family protein [unclassified Chelatococcus]|uniref:DUF1937 family protein n=1 Tax=unclassified Chelatococcus TaxID=2638111 RepID=UPI001BD176E6|nr:MULTISPECIES: DUF1937 family protein [unclassified Chelatococcus]MBS7697868.1 DUF1937 family protein [Chelatococcus sp. YT9]MBX3558554.1 DUF1937 family protein [Chelatococcus sp.]
MMCEACQGAGLALEDLRNAPGFIYLATPYSKYAAGLDAAAAEASRIAARLMARGFRVLSPIAHSHAVSEAGNLDKMHPELWAYQDGPLLDAAAAVVVVLMPGWAESAGVRAEIDIARKQRKPIVFLHPEHA